MILWLFYGQNFKENFEGSHGFLRNKNSENISPKSDPPKRNYEGKILNPKPEFIFG